MSLKTDYEQYLKQHANARRFQIAKDLNTSEGVIVALQGHATILTEVEPKHLDELKAWIENNDLMILTNNGLAVQEIMGRFQMESDMIWNQHASVQFNDTSLDQLYWVFSNESKTATPLWSIQFFSPSGEPWLKMFQKTKDPHHNFYTKLSDSAEVVQESHWKSTHPLETSESVQAELCSKEMPWISEFFQNIKKCQLGIHTQSHDIEVAWEGVVQATMARGPWENIIQPEVNLHFNPQAITEVQWENDQLKFYNVRGQSVTFNHLDNYPELQKFISQHLHQTEAAL